jgi:hypothetical protein
MRILGLSLFYSILFLAFSSQAKENCDNALDSVPKFESSKKMFNEIFQFKNKYSHCLDGGIAEGISSVIVESLDKNWSQVGDVESLNKTDSSFKKFVLINIQPNVTGQEIEVKSIINKAKKSCPKKMKTFCRDLVKSCEQSLKAE